MNAAEAAQNTLCAIAARTTTAAPATGAVSFPLRRHWRLWLALSIGGFIGYHALLIAALVVRFEGIPNYITVFTLSRNYALIWRGTPALSDALSIMAQEPWLEIGYRDPEYFNIAEWSFMLLPVRCLAVAITAMLMATTLVLALRRDGGEACPSPATRRACVVASGVGGGLLGLTNATLTWVVCCATPSWIVLLSMFGVSIGFAQALKPLDGVLALTGFVLCALAIALLVQSMRRARPAFR